MLGHQDMLFPPPETQAGPPKPAASSRREPSHPDPSQDRAQQQVCLELVGQL